mmetsp:Transcript_20506/g.42966  ORF Transcript_20506/g.42966 Transcript_20506/m.42966 type:complete len:207 (-) Transcript_20506:48-668(-)
MVKSTFLSRRSVLSAPFLTPIFHQEHKVGSSCLTFDQGIAILRQACPLNFVKGVQESGRFLYRGDSISCPTVMNPEPDLFFPGTYGSQEAVEFFSCLEQRLPPSSRVRPSNGHIGTATKEDARAWGDAVSIWPLDPRFEYVWPKTGSLFFPGNCSDDFVVGQGLTEALVSGKEIMISGHFIAFPDRFDGELLRYCGLLGEDSLQIH